MSETLLLLTVIVPLALVLLWPARRCRPWVGRFGLLAPLPAILLVTAGEHVVVELPWLLLGTRAAMDTTGQVFLGFTATLWLASGIFARSYLAHDPHRERFELFWLLTMSGNLGLIVAQDMVSFLLFFTLMSFSAYGLITHDRTLESLRAGRIYIVLAIFGEILLFWAAVLAVHQTGSFDFDDLTTGLAGSPLRSVIAGLLLVGFGIKLGMMPLHFWLPLAHPAAPTPASAVLSGAIIKTGLLGMIRFLPLGEVAMYEWGVICVAVGIASAFIGVLIGLTQHNPKTVLAYSSVSQMGLVSIGLGAALMVPEAWPTIRAAILLFAVHHAVTKAALFLGVGVAQTNMASRTSQALVTSGLVLAALALAGLPLTSGFVAKNGLKYAAAAMPEFWALSLVWLVPLTGITTTLLVCRFLYLVRPSRPSSHGQLSSSMAITWGILTVGPVVLFVSSGAVQAIPATWSSLTLVKVWGATWPLIGAGVLVFVLCVHPSSRARLRKIRIPAGDLIVPVTIVSAWCLRVWNRTVVYSISAMIRAIRGPFTRRVAPHCLQVLIRIEHRVSTDFAAGVLVGLLIVAMFMLMIFVTL